MNSTKLLIGGAIAIIAGAALVTGASKLKNLSTKFKANAGIPQNVSLKGGNLSFNLPIEITNQSAFDVTLQNLYVTVQNKNANGDFEDLFIQNNGIKEVKINKLVTSRLATIPLSTSYANAAKLVNILTGKLSSDLKVIVRFDILSYELNPLEFIVNAKDMLTPFMTILRTFGLLKGLGYADNNFHYRKIKPATAYINLMPVSKGLESVIAQDAIPEKTVKRMAAIVNETLWQTKKLAAELKGNSLEESCRNVYDFLYNHIQYKRDEENREQLREPIASFAHRSSGIDCDCFSIFASSLLTNMGINHAIKVISVRDDQQLQHVYVVVPKDGKNLNNYFTIDACLHSFNEEAQGITKEISEIMYTTRLSGLGGNTPKAMALQIAGLEGFFPAILTAEKMPNKTAAVAKVTDNANKLLVDNPVTKMPKSNIQKSNMAVAPSGAIMHMSDVAKTAMPTIIINNNFGGGSGKSCAPKPTPKVVIGPGTPKSIGELEEGPKQLRPFTQDELFKLANVALQPVYDSLKDLYNMAVNQPQLLAPLYNVAELKPALHELLSVWHDSTKRNAVLDKLTVNEVRFLNRDGLAREQLIKRGLAGLSGGANYPMFGLDGNGNVAMANAKGGLFASYRSMISSIEANIIANARNAENYVKQEIAQAQVQGLGFLKKLGNVVKKAATAVGGAVKQAANFVVENVQKINPVMVLGRTAYRGLVALNFRGWATKIDKMRQAGTEGKFKEKWEGALIGGNWGDLVSAVNSGKGKSAILGGIGNLGEPTTIAASIAAATPVIAAVSSFIDDVSNVVGKANDVKNSVIEIKEAVMPSARSGAVTLVPDGGKAGAVYFDPNNPGATDPNNGGNNNGGGNKSNMLLYAAIALLVAGGGYYMYTQKDTAKSKPVGELAAVTKAKKVIKTAKI